MKYLLLATSLSLVAAPAFSGELPSDDTQADRASFDQVDTDQDGAISRQEASAFAALELVFESADRNGDGQIDTQEYAETRLPVKAQ